MDMILRVLIRGRVQGIGYRAWTEITALERGVEGWVRNRRDGSVEALFAGPEAVVLDMIELCREGPPGARVDDVAQRAALSEDLALRRRGELFSVLATLGMSTGGPNSGTHSARRTRSTSASETRRPRSASEVTP